MLNHQATLSQGGHRGDTKLDREITIIKSIEGFLT